jgi:hypothetical protein
MSSKQKEVLSQHVVTEFGDFCKGEKIAVICENYSGGALFLFDLAAQLLINGKKIGVVADELSSEEVISKLKVAITDLINFDVVQDEVTASVLGRLGGKVIIFAELPDFYVSGEWGSAEHIADLDAIFCFSSSDYLNLSRLVSILDQAANLQKASEKWGIASAYLIRGKSSLDARFGVNYLSLASKFDRVFFTSTVSEKLRVEELDKLGHTINSTDPDFV